MARCLRRRARLGFLFAIVGLVWLPSLSAQTTNVEPVRIPSGNAVLSGSMFLADGRGPHPTVLLLHGLIPDKVLFPEHEGNVADLAEPLREAGFNVLFFYYRGVLNSGGEYSLMGQLDDVKAALAFVQAQAKRFQADPTRLAVVGHSLGGFGALITSVERSDVDCTVGLATGNWARPAEQPRPNRPSRPSDDEPRAALGGFTMRALIEEMNANRARLDAAAQMDALKGRPLLLVQAQQDRVGGGIEPIFEAAQAAGVAPLDLVQIDADHDFSLDGNRAELATVVVSWLTEHCI